jgi:hypothetical protein
MQPNFRLPNDTQHIAIMGRNGTGKTWAGVWHLSMRPFHKKPFLILNFKDDELINEIPHARHITPSEFPKYPGIYNVHALPGEEDLVEALLMRAWASEDVGVFVDEAYMLTPNGRFNRGFRYLLTQGRSKHIPLITLSQRPLWVDRFVFSESTFFQVFALSDERDRDTVASFVPGDFDYQLPPYHSWYYDVGANQGQGKVTVMGPVPGKQKMLDDFDAKMKLVTRTRFL